MAVKKRSSPGWEDVRVFAALARLGSLSAAARVLGVTRATVARRLQSLEEALGARLAERRVDGYHLTDAGKRVLLSATEMESASSRLERALQADTGSLRGHVRVSAPPSLTHAFFGPVLAAFAQQNPLLDLEVATDFRLVSLERREADLVLRLGRPQAGDLIAQRLGAVRYGFFAASPWAERLAGGQAPSFIGFDEQNAALPEARWLVEQFPEPRFAMRTSNQVLQAQAAALGLGIALLPDVVAAAQSGLLRVPLRPAPPPRDLWVVRHRLDRGNPVVKAVWDALARAFTEERSFFTPHAA